jgi:CPA2 family monovalent cation:H+ antiporter-2
MFGHPRSTALMIAASRAQIGEFSFILAGLGVSLALLPEPGRDLILSGAIISILLNPLMFAAIDRIQAKREVAAPEVLAAKVATPSREPIPPTSLAGHVVLIGYGRVGSVVGEALTNAGVPLLVIEDKSDTAARLRAQGIETIAGNAADPEVVRAANFGAARCLLVAIPDAFEGGQVVEQARAIARGLRIVARAHSEEEIAHLRKRGATSVIMGEHLIANAMIADVHENDAPASARTEASVLPAERASGAGSS